MKKGVVKIEFQDYQTSVREALDLIGAAEALSGQEKIVIKPNLIMNSPPPTTTDVRFIEAIALYCKDCAPERAGIIVAEGSSGDDTWSCYEDLGYVRMARRTGIELVNLDDEDFDYRYNEDAVIYKEFPVPKTMQTGFIISAPTLKDHSITGTTLSLKNMIGICPAEKFSGYWNFRKSEVHRHSVNQAIIDINLHRPIDLAIVDGSVGQKQCHLSGPPCSPPRNKIIAGFDPVAVDVAGSELLGWRWRDIEYLRLADGVLGRAT